MGRFLKLNQDISKLGMEVLNNQDLCKLLHYPGRDPLSEPYVDGYEHVYDKRLLMFAPKIFIDNNTSDVGSYLCIRPNDIRPTNHGYLRVSLLWLDILTHHDSRRIKGGDRPMHIADTLEGIMENLQISIGKPNYINCHEIGNTNMTFTGYRMIYEDLDFKR